MLLSGGCSRCFALLEAFAAVHWPPLRGFEWNRCFTLASGTDRLGLYPLKAAAALRNPKRLGALALAALATFGFVLELLIVEEKLFARSENEVGAAIHALENLVLELH